MAELLDLKSSTTFGSFSIFNVKPRSRTRRSRTRFSDDQIRLLVESFAINPYPDFETRQKLADQVHVTESRIAVWFQNKRTRTRRAKGLVAGTPGPHSYNSINVFTPEIANDGFQSTSDPSPHETSGFQDSKSSDSTFARLPAESDESSLPQPKRRRLDFESGPNPIRESPSRDEASRLSDSQVTGSTECSIDSAQDTSSIDSSDTPLDLSMPRDRFQPITAPRLTYTPLVDFHKRWLAMHPHHALQYSMYVASLMNGYSSVAKQQFTSPTTFQNERS